MFIGAVFNVALYGIMITQVYLYFYTGKKDRTWLKCIVLFLFLADTVNAIFNLVYVYDALVINFNNVQYLATANWIFATIPAMTGIISSCVQLCYAWRIKVITNNIWAVTFIIVCATISMLASIGTSIAVEIVSIFSEFVRFKVVATIWLVAAILADVCIATSLTHHLQKHKTGFGATDDMLDRIIRLTVQTGSTTAICAFVHLTLYLADKTGIHLIFGVPLSKLYTNSLMSSLNARVIWKFPLGSSRPHFANGDSTLTKSQVRSGDVIFLTTETRPEVFVHVDSDKRVQSDKSSKPDLFLDAESGLREAEDVGGGSVISVV